MKTVIYKKSVLFIPLLILVLAFSFMAKAEPEPIQKNIPLECSKIPGRTDHLCVLETQASYGPYDDVVFYRMDKDGYLTLLGSQSGGVATFGGFDFSSAGTYMWLSWAEEGHPNFGFYRTNAFMKNGTSAKMLEMLSDYYFYDFEEFTEKGEVLYRLSDGAFENCDEAGEDVSYKVDAETSERYCVKRFSLKAP